MNQKKKKLLFVVNSSTFFVSHRLPIAIEAIRQGYQVYLATHVDREVSSKKISNEGITFINLPFTRRGISIFYELNIFFHLIYLFMTIKPDLIHLVSIKPIIFGGIAARILKINSVVFAISGLGTVFLNNSFLGKLRKLLVIMLYRLALSNQKHKIIFQNPDDRDFIMSKLGQDQNSSRQVILHGSGVSLEEFSYLPEPITTPTVVMVSRLLRDKGLIEYIEAAEYLKNENIKVRMVVIGDIDEDNESSISKKEFIYFKSKKFIDFLGPREDIALQYSNSNIVCLPSYREGLPKSLIEAAAAGRSVITTDVPGCKHVIIPEKTGVLVPAKDSFALFQAIKKLINDDRLRRSMGFNGRKLAEERFSISLIVAEHMRIYREILQQFG